VRTFKVVADFNNFAFGGKLSFFVQANSKEEAEQIGLKKLSIHFSGNSTVYEAQGVKVYNA